MKKGIGVAVMIICFVIGGFAQGRQTFSEQYHVEKETVIGGFGSSILLGFPTNNGFAAAIGGGGGIVIDNFYLGVFGVSQGIDNYELATTQTRHNVDLIYGGLWLGYSFYDNWKLHPFVSLRSGFGVLETYKENSDATVLMSKSMIVLTPEAGLEFNVNKNIRIAGAIGYRQLSEFDRRKLPTEDYSGITANLSFRFVFNK